MRRAAVVIGVLGFALLAAIGLRMVLQPVRAPVPPVRVTFDIIDEDASSSLIRVAQMAGYFRDQGLAADIRTFVTGNQALQDLLHNPNVDYAVAYETPVIGALTTGTDLRLLTSLHSSTTNTHIVFKGAGDTPQALIGKRIALTLGSNVEYALSVYLMSQGLGNEQVRRIDLGPAAIVEQATSPTLDGFVLWEPYYSQAMDRLQAASIASWQPQIRFYREFSYLVTAPDRAARLQPASERVLRALLAAAALQRNDRPRFLQLAAAFPGMRRDASTIGHDLEGSELRLGLSNLMRQAMLNEQHAYCHSHACDPQADQRLDQAFDPDALNAVIPDAVTLQRMP